MTSKGPWTLASIKEELNKGISQREQDLFNCSKIVDSLVLEGIMPTHENVHEWTDDDIQYYLMHFKEYYT